jgi:hypothetical protein
MASMETGRMRNSGTQGWIECRKASRTSGAPSSVGPRPVGSPSGTRITAWQEVEESEW